AVTAVLLYHCRFGLAAGGYVGVDVFFALSGFLMTGLLLAERTRTGGVAFRDFYARRVRRLLPASVLVLVVTTVASWLVLYPLPFRSAARDAAAAGAYVVNYRFAVEGADYLGAQVAESPVLHYWSLAVEEQFYVLWPVLVVLLLGRGRLRSGRAVAGVAVVGVASFAAAAVLTPTSQPWAFFSLPTRAWEFAVGAVAALVWSHVRERAPRARALLGWAGMAAVAASVVLMDATTPFPAPWALAPVLGTTAVLLAGGAPRGPAVLLDRGPCQWVGIRSYSLYLWHWPPLVLVPVVVGRTLTTWENLGVVLVASVVAVAAYHLVEQPLRRGRWLSARPARAALLGAGLTAVAVLVPVGMAATVSADGGGTAAPARTDPAHATLDRLDPAALPGGARVLGLDRTGQVPLPVNLTPPADAAGDELPSNYTGGCNVGLNGTDPAPVDPCVVGDPNGTRTVAVFGDSHAAQWLPALEAAGRVHGWRVVPFTKSGCPSVDVVNWNSRLSRRYQECEAWRDAAVERLGRLRPDLVVVANRAAYKGLDQQPLPVEDSARGLATTVDRLGRAGVPVLVLGPTPELGGSPPACVTGHTDDVRPCDLTSSTAAPRRFTRAWAEVARVADVPFVDPLTWLCGGATCPVVLDQFLVYRDDSHLSVPYARWLGPVLGLELRRAVPALQTG
ncbi:MAG: acyltransferase family protein, partial [Actinomycetes bacterium]